MNHPRQSSEIRHMSGNYNCGRILFGIVIVVACAFVAPHNSMAQLATAPPAELESVGIDEHRGDKLPLDLQFVDHRGQVLRLAELFDGKRPVILSLNYSDCPMLCNLQLRGLTDALSKIEWKLGEQFRIVTASINPNETPKRAREAQKNYVQAYGGETTDDGWTLLTGKDSAITRLADAVGFRYTFVPERGEYAHTAALMICTPDGTISRYMYGIEYDPVTLRLSTIEAADGKIGSAVDQLILYCFHYDAEKGRYGPVAMNLMRVGALMTVTLIGVGFVILRAKERLTVAGVGQTASNDTDRADFTDKTRDTHPAGDHSGTEPISAINHTATEERGLEGFREGEARQ